jgi:hypothetical protein
LPCEYYDRGPTADNLLPANTQLQDAYWLLRSNLTSAIAAELPKLCARSLRIAEAAAALESFMQSNRTRSFKIIRPEDADFTQDASSSPFFLR